MKPGDDPKDFDWAHVVDVLGIVHTYWSRPQRLRWYRLCLDAGPEVASRPEELPMTAPVTCLWCLRVESTL